MEVITSSACTSRYTKFGKMIFDTSQSQCECSVLELAIPNLLQYPKCPHIYTTKDLNRASDNTMGVVTYWLKQFQ